MVKANSKGRVVRIDTQQERSSKISLLFSEGGFPFGAKKGFKGAGLKHISKDYVQSIEFPLLSETDQSRIIEEFDAIVAQIESSGIQIALLDEHVKSPNF